MTKFKLWTSASASAFAFDNTSVHPPPVQYSTVKRAKSHSLLAHFLYPRLYVSCFIGGVRPVFLIIDPPSLLLRLVRSQPASQIVAQPSQNLPMTATEVVCLSLHQPLPWDQSIWTDMPIQISSVSQESCPSTGSRDPES
jgi:hypothetical protein